MTDKEKKALNERLFIALEKESPIEEIKGLIERGADVNARDGLGKTALMLAETAEQTKLLFERGAKIEDGMEAIVWAKTAEQTKLLIEAGADVNVKGPFEETALMNAKTVEQMKLLIEQGADVNARDAGGYTPLMRAKTAEQIKLLLERGADVNAETASGSCALDYYLTRNTASYSLGTISFSGEAEAVKLLVEAGAKLKENQRIIGDEEYDSKWVIKEIFSNVYEPEMVELMCDRVCDSGGIRKHIEQRKANIKKSHQLRQKLRAEHSEEKVSGVALADEIAKDKISGKEKRVITPEVGAEIRRQKGLEK